MCAVAGSRDVIARWPPGEYTHRAAKSAPPTCDPEPRSYRGRQSMSSQVVRHSCQTSHAWVRLTRRSSSNVDAALLIGVPTTRHRTLARWESFRRKSHHRCDAMSYLFAGRRHNPTRRSNAHAPPNRSPDSPQLAQPRSLTPTSVCPPSPPEPVVLPVFGRLGPPLVLVDSGPVPSSPATPVDPTVPAPPLESPPVGRHIAPRPVFAHSSEPLHCSRKRDWPPLSAHRRTAPREQKVSPGVQTCGSHVLLARQYSPRPQCASSRQAWHVESSRSQWGCRGGQSASVRHAKMHSPWLAHCMPSVQCSSSTHSSQVPSGMSQYGAQSLKQSSSSVQGGLPMSKIGTPAMAGEAATNNEPQYRPEPSRSLLIASLKRNRVPT